jgi:hypothetical protein
MAGFITVMVFTLPENDRKGDPEYMAAGYAYAGTGRYLPSLFYHFRFLPVYHSFFIYMKC